MQYCLDRSYRVPYRLTMANKQSRDRKTNADRRRYEGENEASFLLAALNGETVIDPKQLPGIVDALKGIASCEWITGRNLLSANTKVREHQSKIDAVNARLRYLEAVPVLLPPSTLSDGHIRLEWRRTIQSVTTSKQPRESANLELSAILCAITLTQIQRIGSVRQCDWCHRWMYAKFSHSRFCPHRDCKELFHQEDPARREAKRVKARENYKYMHRK
jgi:hypothetical protein